MLTLILGGKGGARRIFGGKDVTNVRKNLPFHAEIVNVWLTFTHMQLFWRKIGGQKIIWGHAPPPPATPL